MTVTERNKHASRETTPENFWGRVERGTADQCWPWTGRTNEDGYGVVGYHSRRGIGAHRVAWALARNGGTLPDLWVLHHCDNPPCCNPDHLFLGTATENNRDRARKGRTKGWAGRSGPDHHRFKVTDEMRSEMRSLRAAGFTQLAIAERFGVSRGYVAHVAAGVLPKHQNGALR